MYAAALLFGVFSSLHCMGMCGPIALMLPLGRTRGAAKWIRVLLYHCGRLCTYGSIGLLFGLAGKVLQLGGLQQRMSIIAGVAMLVIALVPERLIGHVGFLGPIAMGIGKLKSALGQLFAKTSLISFFSIGLLNGLLPCGLVYAAVFGAMATGSAFSGSLFLLCFGLGTMPMLLLVHIIGDFIRPQVRSRILKIIPIAVASLGILFILRGAGLDIPYLSPSAINLRVMADPNCH